MDKQNTIASVAERTGLTPHTLRYYEKIGLLGPVPRDDGGRRAYGERDLNRLHFLQKLRTTGMSIKHMREYIRLADDVPDSLAMRREMLESHSARVEAQILELTECRSVIQTKIAMYKRWESEECKNEN